MSGLPHVENVKVTKVQLEPGTRLLVRSVNLLTRDARKRIHKTVQKWAGDHVEVLVVDPSINISIFDRRTK